MKPLEIRSCNHQHQMEWKKKIRYQSKYIVNILHYLTRNIFYYAQNKNYYNFGSQKSANKIHIGSYDGAGGNSVKTINIRSILSVNGIDYTKITSDNFWIKSCNASSYIEGSNSTHRTSPSISYNSANGNMTVSGLFYSPSINRSIWVYVDVWVIL